METNAEKLLKAYTLTLSDLKPFGITEIPSGPMRLNNVENIKNMREAEVVVIPIPLRETDWLTPAVLKKIVDYYKLDQRRVVCFDCSDFEADCADPAINEAIFVRCNGSKGWMHKRMPNTISWPWPVEDLKELMPVPEGGFRYDVGFHGWLSCNVRINAVNSVDTVFRAQADLVTYKDFFGYCERDHGKTEETRRRRLFLTSLRQCRLQLAPRSICYVFPYRFYEAMSAGRVPVLFCDDYVLPFQNKIDWDACTIRFGDQDSTHAGKLIKEWLNKHNDPEDKYIIEMGKRAREAWDKWLNPAKWSDLWTLAVTEKLRAQGLLVER